MIQENIECLGLMGKIFGHKFKTVVTYGPITRSFNAEGMGIKDLEVLRPIHSTKIYCPRCGCESVDEP